jgi:hypothetical protein
VEGVEFGIGCHFCGDDVYSVDQRVIDGRWGEMKRLQTIADVFFDDDECTER